MASWVSAAELSRDTLGDEGTEHQAPEVAGRGCAPPHLPRVSRRPHRCSSPRFLSKLKDLSQALMLLQMLPINTPTELERPY